MGVCKCINLIDTEVGIFIFWLCFFNYFLYFWPWVALFRTLPLLFCCFSFSINNRNICIIFYHFFFFSSISPSPSDVEDLFYRLTLEKIFLHSLFDVSALPGRWHTLSPSLTIKFDIGAYFHYFIAFFFKWYSLTQTSLSVFNDFPYFAIMEIHATI